MATLQDFAPLKPAEQKLLAVSSAGKQCSFARTRPEAPSDENLIRADFLRFLAVDRDVAATVHDGSLRVQGAYIDGTVNLDGARKVRPLWIVDCAISGEFSFADADTKVVSLDRTAVSSIRGDGVMIDGSLLLRGAAIDGSLQLFGAEITAALSCAGCRIEGRRWRSQRLAADLTTVTVGGNVEFRSGFQANGLVHFDDSEIGGTFDCSEGKFFSGFDPDMEQVSRWDGAVRALKCHRLNLKGSLYLRGCESDGEMSFSGAQIGGDIDCRNGRFRGTGNGDTAALRFTRIEAGGSIYLSSGFTAFGKVQFNGARVRGNIDCKGGVFSVPEGVVSRDFAAPGEAFSEDAMSLVNAEIGSALILGPIPGKDDRAAAFDGSLDLKSAHIHVLVDSLEAWPEETHTNGLRNVIHLDGFTYDRFGGSAPIDAETRVKWLMRQPQAHLGVDFKPQPFEQLIAVLQSMGHPEEARRVAMRRQKFLLGRPFRAKPARAAWNSVDAIAFQIEKFFFWVFGILLGHGYRPARVFWAMALIGITCGYYYKLAAEQGVFAPRDSQVFLASDFKECRPDKWMRCTQIAPGFAEYPKFDPWVYSFNVLLPVVDLYQEKAWAPMQKKVQVTILGEEIVLPDGATNAVVVAEIVFGWVASLLLVATFSGLVKTD
jgi:hypothetical protein